MSAMGGKRTLGGLTALEQGLGECGLKLWLPLIALTAIAPHGPANAADAEAVPLNDPGSWVSAGDYPPDSRRNREEGQVSFRLTVGGDGRPSACAIVKSSGFESLDSVTCRLLLQRARFHPPVDAIGPVSSASYEKTISWALASLNVQDSPSVNYTLRIDVNEDGLVQSCEVIASKRYVLEGQTAGPSNPCPTVGTPFTKDFVSRTSRSKRSFLITESITELR